MRKVSSPHTPLPRWRSGWGFPLVAVGGRLEAGAGPGGGGELGSLSCQGGQGHTVAATEEQAALTSRGARHSTLLHGTGPLKAADIPGSWSRDSAGFCLLSAPGLPGIWHSEPWSGAAAATASFCSYLWCWV